MKPKIERERVNLRVPAPLLSWARAYAFKTNKTLTQLIVDLLSNAKAGALKDDH
jgi:hypothetical protein